MEKYKVVFAGPVGAGKTAAVRAVTDSHFVLTDAAVSDATGLRKSTTTVAMDYGVVALSGHEQAHIYGTPGQERFDFMWDILLKGCHGLVILLDGSRNNPYRDLKHYLEAFATFIRPTNTIIGVTHFDDEQASKTPLDAYRQWVADFSLQTGVLAVDARNKQDILPLITQVLEPVRGIFMHDNKHHPPEIPEQPTAMATPAYYEAEERLTLDESAMEKASALPGVTGVSLTSEMGELLHSTLDDAPLNEFIAFLSGITPGIEEVAGLGRMQRIMLKSPQAENLTVLVENGRSLGIQSQARASLQAIGQQVEDMLQWS